LQAFTAEQLDKAEFKARLLQRSRSSALALKLQVLLDRAHASPGVIDGVYGASNIQAIKNFQIMNGLEPDGKIDKDIWEKLRQAGGDAPILKDYEITKDDVKGPFLESVPEDYTEKAKLKRLGFTSAGEGLAEKFHMDEGFLAALNPGKAFDKAGEIIIVIDTGGRMESQVQRIEVDGRENVLRAYDGANRLLSAYPATIGSTDTPSPSGSAKVRTIAQDPAYYYNPNKLNFAEVETKEQLKIAPGPNNPVGAVWIDLDRETYGIHGTADPADIGKETSHGCVRLTNWDVEELAAVVKKGTPVDFMNVIAAR